MTKVAEAHLELTPLEQSEKRPVLLAAGIFCALSVLSAALSRGFLEADATSHYLAARFAFEQPYRFISVWDRPLFVLLYCVPARLGGPLGARLMSLVLAMCCAAITWAIARRLRLARPAVAAGCLLVQPLFFLHSFAEMTELMFAAVLGLAFLGYVSRRWWLLALAAGLAPLGRPEGFGFLLIALGALVLHRRWWALLILPAPLLGWSLAGWKLFGLPDYGWGALSFLRWLPRNWPYSGTSSYQSGPLLLTSVGEGGEGLASFLLRLPVIVSPILLPFVIWGAWRMLVQGVKGGKAYLAGLARRGGSAGSEAMETNQAMEMNRVLFCRLLAAGIPLGVLAGHSVLWWRGLMASSGELRYLLIASPFWALLAAEGLNWATGRRRKLAWATLALAGATPIIWNFCYMVVPLGQYDDDRLAAEVVRWYRGDAEVQQRYPKLCAASVCVYKELDAPPGDGERSIRWGRDTVQKRPRDVVLIWDATNATHNADNELIVPRQMLLENGWRPLRSFERGGRAWELFVQPHSEEAGDAR